MLLAAKDRADGCAPAGWRSAAPHGPGHWAHGRRKTARLREEAPGHGHGGAGPRAHRLEGVKPARCESEEAAEP